MKEFIKDMWVDNHVVARIMLVVGSLALLALLAGFVRTVVLFPLDVLILAVIAGVVVSVLYVIVVVGDYFANRRN